MPRPEPTRGRVVLERDVLDVAWPLGNDRRDDLVGQHVQVGLLGSRDFGEDGRAAWPVLGRALGVGGLDKGPDPDLAVEVPVAVGVVGIVSRLRHGRQKGKLSNKPFVARPWLRRRLPWREYVLAAITRDSEYLHVQVQGVLKAWKREHGYIKVRFLGFIHLIQTKFHSTSHVLLRERGLEGARRRLEPTLLVVPVQARGGDVGRG